MKNNQSNFNSLIERSFSNKGNNSFLSYYSQFYNNKESNINNNISFRQNYCDLYLDNINNCLISSNI